MGWLYSLKFDVFAFINSLCPLLGLCELWVLWQEVLHTQCLCTKLPAPFCPCPLPCAGLTPWQAVTQQNVLIQANCGTHLSMVLPICLSWLSFALFHVTPWSYALSQDVLFLYSFLIFPCPVSFLGSQLMLLSADVFVIKISKLLFMQEYGQSGSLSMWNLGVYFLKIYISCQWIKSVFPKLDGFLAIVKCPPCLCFVPQVFHFCSLCPLKEGQWQVARGSWPESPLYLLMCRNSVVIILIVKPHWWLLCTAKTVYFCLQAVYTYPRVNTLCLTSGLLNILQSCGAETSISLLYSFLFVDFFFFFNSFMFCEIGFSLVIT